MIWAYFNQKNLNQHLLIIQIQVICLIHTKLDHKHVLYSHVVALLYHNALQSKLYLPHFQIMLKLLQSIKLVENTCGEIDDSAYSKNMWTIIEKKSPKILYKDNIACIVQLKKGYIKKDRTKYVIEFYFFLCMISRKLVT